MGVFCEVCNVTVPSEVVMKDHVKGKKHLRMADIVNRQKRQAERSVFVRGFSYGTKEVTLRKLFSNYGPVDLVFVDRERGSYAIVEFRSRNAVETLLQPGHACYLGHKKLTIKPREVKAYVPKKKPEQLPQTEEEKEPIPEVPKYDIEAVLSELPSLDDVCTQMKVLRERLKLTEEDMKQREEICQDLEAAASKIFTLCEANQFGSSVNGFGMRGCDMDIFLDLNLELKPKPADEEQSLPATELPFTKDIKAVKVVEGRITHESLKKTSWRDRIKLLGRILGGTPKFGKNVLTIPSARCPVIKVTHQATGMKCDISINNKMALRNTKFLQFLGQEERLGTLVYTAKIWAKLKDITGQGPRITSYTFTLLVIFFLQRTSPPVFPSVKELSKMTPPNESVSLEKWECSFPQQLPPTENKSTAEELLKQFFEFYSYFDFNTYVINIRDGVAEDINEFRAKALESAQLETFKPNEGGSGVVYIGHIPHGFHEMQMRKYFEQFGTVKRVKVSRSKKTGGVKGYAFVQFKDDFVAKVVCDSMDNYLMFHKLLKCKYVPISQLHPQTFKGSERPFFKPKAHIVSGIRHNQKKSTEKLNDLQKKTIEKTKKSIQKLHDMGIDFEFPGLTDIQNAKHSCDPKHKDIVRKLERKKNKKNKKNKGKSTVSKTPIATEDSEEMGVDFGDADLDSSLVMAAKSFLLDDSDEDEIEFPHTPPGARRKSLSEFKQTPLNAAKLALKSDSVRSSGRKRKAQTSTPTAKRRK